MFTRKTFKKLRKTVLITLKFKSDFSKRSTHSYKTLNQSLTVADLVMPWFMFMMGVSFTFSLKSLDKKGSSKRQMMIKVVSRCVKLFVIGLFLINGSTSWQSVRVPGVLQRFAICYLVGTFSSLSEFFTVQSLRYFDFHRHFLTILLVFV